MCCWEVGEGVLMVCNAIKSQHEAGKKYGWQRGGEGCFQPTKTLVMLRLPPTSTSLNSMAVSPGSRTAST